MDAEKWRSFLKCDNSFFSAMSIEGGQDDDGNDVPPSFMDYFLHFLTFFWKLVGAMVPPT